MKATHTKTDNSHCDVVVIGGGPAGMMAAATAAKKGAHVLLLEKNPALGKKLLITGGGRCNVTNNKPVVREMLSQYKSEGKFLFSTFMQHGVKESIDWFEDRAVHLKEENEGRLFPLTENAQTIRDALASELEECHVTIKNNAQVATIQKDKNRFHVRLKSGQTFTAPACVVATGGSARPETGSTGEGFVWLKNLGHTIVENTFALVPITLGTGWSKKLSGVALPVCRITLLADGQKHSSVKGKILFTHVGVTGPTILNMSKTVGELLSYGPVTLLIDLFPGVDSAEMHQMLQNVLQKNNNKKIRNALTELLPTAVAKEILIQCHIDGETQCNSVTKVQRIHLIEFLKAIPLEVSGLLGKDKAVVSSGGVTLEEIDFKTMESKVVENLYVVGDVLNINRPSGGYSLQLCWSTGAVAGMAAAEGVQKLFKDIRDCR
jgi:predicted Rossmann fold flavoprotein